MGTRPRGDGLRKLESTQPRARREEISHHRHPWAQRRTVTELLGGKTVCTSKWEPGPPRTFNERVVELVNAQATAGTTQEPTRRSLNAVPRSMGNSL